jgi:predicted MFS family arabinose efflux permease
LLLTANGAGVKRRGGLLRQRDFRLLWTGETASQLGNTVTVVVMPLIAVTVLHVSTFLVGLLAAAGWLPTLLIGLPAGAWVDRLPRRPVMLACDAASLLLYASVPATAVFGLLSVGQLLGVALLAGCARVLFQTAYSAYLPALVARSALREGNAKLQGSARAAEVGGRGLGGVLAQLLGPATALLADAASFCVSAVSLLGIRATEPRPKQANTSGQRGSLRREITDGLRFVTGDSYLRILAAFIAVANMAQIGFLTLEVVFLVRDVGVEPALIGGLVAATSAGGILGAAGVGIITRRLGSARGLLLTALVSFPFALLIPLTSPGAGLAFLIGGYLVTGAGVTAIDVMLISFWQTYCPPQMLGRLTATIWFLVQGGIPLGALLAGVLGDALGNRTTLWITAGLLTLAGLLLLATPLRAHRDFPTQTSTTTSST